MALAARLKAEAVQSWIRAIYNVSQYRLSLDSNRRRGSHADTVAAGSHVSGIVWMILNAAIAVTEADCGNVQIVDGRDGDLRIVAHRGFGPAFLDYFKTVHRGAAACGAARQGGRRIIVRDVTNSAIFSRCDRAVMRDANARAVQSTPVTEGGGVVAMISTHFQVPHQPSDRQLQLLDALVHNAGPLFAHAPAHDLCAAPSIRSDIAEGAAMTQRLASRIADSGSWVGKYTVG